MAANPQGALKLVGGVAISPNQLLLGTGEVADLNGEADALVLDLDGDTSISADTDDQINIEIGNVDHVVMKKVATADAATTTSIVEIAFTSPVDTTGTNVHNGLNIDIEIGNASGGTNSVNAIAIDNITGDAQVTETGLLCGTGFDIGIDMQGTKIDLDANNDTSIIASTDNQIDIEINGANDFQFTANTFTALTGSTIATNTIAETDSATGVTIDSLLVKDAGVVVGTGGALDLNGEAGGLVMDVDGDTKIYSGGANNITVNVAGASDFTITANTLTALSGSTIATNTIAETTGGSGVTIDGALVKDGHTDAGRHVQTLTSSDAITINSGMVALQHNSTPVAATLDAPAVGDELLIVDNSASGTAAHTVTLTGATWNGTNTIATLDAPGEAIHVLAIATNRFLILNNVGSVAFSGP